MTSGDAEAILNARQHRQSLDSGIVEHTYYLCAASYEERPMPADKLGHPPPIVQSMVLADAIHRDPNTRKYFILGTYHILGCDRFPSVPTPLRLYMSITNAHGLTVLRIRIIDVDDAAGPIHESAHTINLSDPNRVWEMTFNVPVVFPMAGHYRIQLLAGNELLRELRLPVILAQPPSGPSEGP